MYSQQQTELDEAAELKILTELELLPNVQLRNKELYDPVIVGQYPHDWVLLGAGNYAAVFCHPTYPDFVVKVYAPGRPGLAEEVEVYRRLGDYPAFSVCLEVGQNFLILRKLQGVTFWNALTQGIPIPYQAILDIEQALNYARSVGLNPHDIHGKNLMLTESGNGVVVDVSDFLKPGNCRMWNDFKRAYFWIYRPLLMPLRLPIPVWLLDQVRFFLSNLAAAEWIGSTPEFRS